MSVEALGEDFIQVPVKNVSDGDSDFTNEEDNGKLNQGLGGQGLEEPIKFGSHGTDEPVKGEGDTIVDANFPKDAVDEWPTPKQIHSFYFVKFRSYEDPQPKAKIDQADKEIKTKHDSR